MSKIYDFDQIVERRGTECLKYDALDKFYGDSELLPLWVADMDFATPDFIIEAMRRRLEHPIFGYTLAYDSYWQSIIDWLRSHHNWAVERESLRYIPGVVKGIAMVINHFTQPGDKIIIQPPVYHPFRLVPRNNDREVVFNPLRRGDNGDFEMDFDQLEQLIDERCKVLILANPHNPIGVVWSRETLARLAEIAVKHNLIVISDEIHCDIALYGNRHTPFVTVSEAAKRCSITFAAPTKTFNVAGLVSSFVVIEDSSLRESFFAYLSANEFDMATIFAMVATEAAFSAQGEQWRQQMVAYIERNIDFVAEYIAENTPQVKVIKPQASYLVWLDFSALGLDHSQVVELVKDKARLAMNDGAIFGIGGEQHMRMNVAAPRSVISQALEQLREAVQSL